MIMRRPKFPSFGGVASGRGGCWLYGYTQIYTDTPVSTNYLLLLLGVFTYYNDHPALRAPLQRRGIATAQHLINSLEQTLPEFKTLAGLYKPDIIELWVTIPRRYMHPRAGFILKQPT